MNINNSYNGWTNNRGPGQGHHGVPGALMIALNVGPLRLEPGSLELDAEIEVRCTGRLSIEADSRVVYEEDDFPCVELARAVRGWADEVEPTVGFEFDSMSWAEPGLVWIRKDPSVGLWRIGSNAAPDAETLGVSWSAIRDAIVTFCADVIGAAPPAVRDRVRRIVCAAPAP